MRQNPNSDYFEKERWDPAELWGYLFKQHKKIKRGKVWPLQNRKHDKGESHFRRGWWRERRHSWVVAGKTAWFTAGMRTAKYLEHGRERTVFRALPIKSLTEESRIYTWGKRLKEGLTCSLLVNAAGDKEKPIITRMSVNLRCFRKILDKATLPCHYYSQVKFLKKFWWNLTLDLEEKIARSFWLWIWLHANQKILETSSLR